MSGEECPLLATTKLSHCPLSSSAYRARPGQLLGLCLPLPPKDGSICHVLQRHVGAWSGCESCPLLADSPPASTAVLFAFHSTAAPRAHTQVCASSPSTAVLLLTGANHNCLSSVENTKWMIKILP